MDDDFTILWSPSPSPSPSTEDDGGQDTLEGNETVTQFLSLTNSHASNTQDEAAPRITHDPSHHQWTERTDLQADHILHPSSSVPHQEFSHSHTAQPEQTPAHSFPDRQFPASDYFSEQASHANSPTDFSDKINTHWTDAHTSSASHNSNFASTDQQRNPDIPSDLHPDARPDVHPDVHPGAYWATRQAPLTPSQPPHDNFPETPHPTNPTPDNPPTDIGWTTGSTPSTTPHDNFPSSTAHDNFPSSTVNDNFPSSTVNDNFSPTGPQPSAGSPTPPEVFSQPPAPIWPTDKQLADPAWPTEIQPLIPQQSDRQQVGAQQLPFPSSPSQECPAQRSVIDAQQPTEIHPVVTSSSFAADTSIVPALPFPLVQEESLDWKNGVNQHPLTAEPAGRTRQRRSGTPVLCLEDVCKEYPGNPPVYALKHINFQVFPGEMVAIVGPSGSGKSTLLHVMGALDLPTSGRVVIGGEEVASMSDQELSAVRAHRIGFVFQQFFLLPGLSTVENVAQGLLYRGIPAAKRRRQAEKTLTRVGLEHRLTHTPEKLSGGERQRVAIARAILGHPAIVLADEPTGNLDSASSQSILKLLHELHKAGTTIVVITHDRETAQALPRQVFIRDGHMEHDTAL